MCWLYFFLEQMNPVSREWVYQHFQALILQALLPERWRPFFLSFNFSSSEWDSHWLGSGHVFILGQKDSQPELDHSIVWKGMEERHCSPEEEIIIPRRKENGLANKHSSLWSTYYMPDSTCRSRSQSQNYSKNISSLGIFRNLVESFGFPLSVKWSFKPILSRSKKVERS